MRQITRRICGLIIGWWGLSFTALAQSDSVSFTAPYAFSIEEDLLNLTVERAEPQKVYAGSRQVENVRDGIASTYVVTAEEIEKSGALNLGEVLRLAPEVLVKQKTNGYFYVSLRGITGATNYRDPSYFENTTVLLMVDGIPITHWFEGGILWETIPVEVNDIQQVEVVATPSSAYFGPNATAGVINIVTKSVKEVGLRTQISLQGGVNGNYAHRGSVGFGISDRLRVRISGHYNRLTRFQEDMYLLNEQRYIGTDSLLYFQSSARQTNPSAEKALNNNGVNMLVTYQPRPNIQVDALASAKESYLQSLIRPLDNIALTNRDSQTSMLALRSRFGNFRTNFSYQSGTLDLAAGYTGFKLRARNLHASGEYDLGKRVYQAKVGADANYNIYDNEIPLGFERTIADLNYADQTILGTSTLGTIGLFLRQQLTLLQGKWRVLLTARGDRLTLTNQIYGSYQLGSTYTVAKGHSIRATTSYSLGNISLQNYLNYNRTTADYEVNNNLNPLRIRAYEVGYRWEPYRDLHLSIVGFSNKNYDLLDSLTANSFIRTNSDDQMIQRGVTLSANGAVSKLDLSAFLTYQHTSNRNNNQRVTDQFSPQLFGGVNGSYRAFLNKLKIGASLYFYDNSALLEESRRYALEGKLITNCKISYNVWDEHVIFFNGRNMLNSQQVEMPYADQINNLYMLGVKLVF
ncbi:MAG: TonB-dependent receptor plug domain-containing protein [Bacteroidota bacterium]